MLTTDLTPQEGCVGHRFPEERLIGRTGVATTVLRPSGKIQVDGAYYDAVAEDGAFVDRGAQVVITRLEYGQIYCKPVDGRA